MEDIGSQSPLLQCSVSTLGTGGRMLTASGSEFLIGHSEEEAWKHTGKVAPTWLLEHWGRGGKSMW